MEINIIKILTTKYSKLLACSRRSQTRYSFFKQFFRTFFSAKITGSYNGRLCVDMSGLKLKSSKTEKMSEDKMDRPKALCSL